MLLPHYIPRFLQCTILCCLMAPITVAQSQNRTAKPQHRIPDKVNSTRTLNGQFVGFEQGDYLHAVLRLKNGTTQSFFLNQPGMEYFLVTRRGQKMHCVYEVVDSYVQEAGGVVTMERLTAVQAGKETYAGWWKQQQKYSFEKLEKKYGALVQKAILSP